MYGTALDIAYFSTIYGIIVKLTGCCLESSV